MTVHGIIWHKVVPTETASSTAVPPGVPDLFPLTRLLSNTRYQPSNLQSFKLHISILRKHNQIIQQSLFTQQQIITHWGHANINSSTNERLHLADNISRQGWRTNLGVKQYYSILIPDFATGAPSTAGRIEQWICQNFRKNNLQLMTADESIVYAFPGLAWRHSSREPMSAAL